MKVHGFNKATSNNLILIALVILPFLTTFYFRQEIFELLFNTFSNQKILVLLPSDSGYALFMLGSVIFFTSLVGVFVSKRNKKPAVYVLILGGLIFLVGLQNYTVFTDTTVNTHNIIPSHTKIIPYSELKNVLLTVSIKDNRPSTRTGFVPSCHTHQTFSIYQSSNEEIEIYVTPLEKDLGYSLIDLLKKDNIRIDAIFDDTCHDPVKSKVLIDEMKRILAK